MTTPQLLHPEPNHPLAQAAAQSGSIASHLATLTGQQRTHLEIAGKLWWHSSFVTGRWWTNGFMALRIFSEPAQPDEVTLTCNCDSHWQINDKSATIPVCCGWEGGEGGGRYAECQASSPADCLHVGVGWDAPNRPTAYELIEAFAERERHPVSVDCVAASNLGHGVEGYRCYANDGRYFYVNRLFDRVLREHVTPDDWVWVTTPHTIAAGKRRRPKRVEAPLLLGLREGELVAALMAYQHDEQIWQPAAARVPA